MPGSDPKSDLHRYLRTARDTVLWKLEGLSEYDVRRPVVPTGTNLLGLVKHLAGIEAGYLGYTFGRPLADPPAWLEEDDPEPNVDNWATAQETREGIVGLYHRVWEHADTTIDALPLDAVGGVPWWPEERKRVTLHAVLVHVVAETNRHAGHADIVRELIDGEIGHLREVSVLPPGDRAWWEGYRDRLERAAREAAGLPPPDH